MVRFYLPICLFEFTARHQVLIYATSCRKFSQKTHTFILLMRGRNYLGSIHLGDGFLYFAVLANRCADTMQLRTGCQILVYRQKRFYPFMLNYKVVYYRGCSMQSVAMEIFMFLTQNTQTPRICLYMGSFLFLYSNLYYPKSFLCYVLETINLNTEVK